MDEDDVGDGDDDDEDEYDVSSSKDPCRRRIDALCKLPSRSLPEARFCKFLVSLCVGSLIRLHGVEVFEEANDAVLWCRVDGGKYS
jgi:hypothetical protein